MKKQNTKLILICVGVVIALVVGVCALTASFVPKTHSRAKAQCERILKRNEAEMTDIAIAALESGKDNSGEFKKYYYSASQRIKTVTFDIGAQGILDNSQYWQLVYVQGGLYRGKSEEYSEEISLTNYITRAEKISGNWWFVWMDWDHSKLTYK